jgi:glycogen synthase
MKTNHPIIQTSSYPIIVWLALLTLSTLNSQLSTAFADVTFSVTPSTVSNTYSGTITLQIGGLTNKTVVIQKFLDLNTNGVVNGANWHLDMFSRDNFNNAKFNGEKNEN